MKRRHLLYASIAAFGLLLFVHVPGCGPALTSGPGPGARGPTSGVLVGTPRVLELPPGTAVTLVLRDQSVVTGTFLATAPIPAEEWCTRYAAARETLHAGGLLPAPGDTVELSRLQGGPVRGTFEGFGFRTVVIRRLGASALYEVPFGRLRSLDYAGSSVAADSLARVADRGALPAMVTILVAVERDTVRVPPERVALAFVPGTRGSAAGGIILAALIGAGLAIAFIAYEVNQANEGCERAVSSAGVSSRHPGLRPSRPAPGRAHSARP